jgi:ParB-like chromosome segregation protein Spo0J
MILDGHQRLSALVSLQRDGWDIPAIPVVYVEASDEEEARRMLLSIASQYGEWQKDELDIWLNDIDASIVETLRLVDESILENKDDKDQKTKTINYDSKIELIVTLQNEVEA